MTKTLQIQRGPTKIGPQRIALHTIQRKMNAVTNKTSESPNQELPSVALHDGAAGRIAGRGLVVDDGGRVRRRRVVLVLVRRLLLLAVVLIGGHRQVAGRSVTVVPPIGGSVPAFARARGLQGRHALHLKYDGVATLFIKVFEDDEKLLGCFPEGD